MFFLNCFSEITKQGEPCSLIIDFTETPSISVTGVYSVLVPNLLDIPVFNFQPINCKTIRWPKKERVCNDYKQNIRNYNRYQIMLDQIVKENPKVDLDQDLEVQ